MRSIESGVPITRLTALSHGAGCACKIPRDRLRSVLDGLPAPGLDHEDLLVGSATADDAAVFRIAPDRALVQTADFFTPIVDEPRDFGRIAATNALSDIYAMGGTPLVALNLLAFPLDGLGSGILAEILAGGAEVVAAAGAVIGGGHSIDDPEPKYGLAVTGVVDPDAMLTNAGAKPGDVLVLTKPIGSGLATTAAKRDIAPPETIAAAVETMCTLNDVAADEAVAAGAKAATDVTGFGLLGHLNEMCLASGVEAEVEAAAVPAIEGALDLAADPRAHAGGSRRNLGQAGGYVDWARDVPPERRVLLTDAMTSGGLLVALPAAAADSVAGAVIGAIGQGPEGTVRVR